MGPVPGDASAVPAQEGVGVDEPSLARVNARVSGDGERFWKLVVVEPEGGEVGELADFGWEVGQLVEVGELADFGCEVGQLELAEHFGIHRETAGLHLKRRNA